MEIHRLGDYVHVITMELDNGHVLIMKMDRFRQWICLDNENRQVQTMYMPSLLLWNIIPLFYSMKLEQIEQ